MPTPTRKTSPAPVAAASAAAARPTPSHVGYLLVRAAAAFRAATASALQPLQISPLAFGLLNQVVLQPAQTQAQLGSALRIDRTTMVALLDRLTAATWIERAPDPSDRRVYRISATRRGAALHARAAAAVLQVEQRFLARLDSAQVTAFVDALTHVAHADDGADDGADDATPGA